MKTIQGIAPTRPRLAMHDLSVKDALGRTAFAKYLLEVALTADSTKEGAVLALTGEWGSGKSWALRQAQGLAESMPSESRPLWFCFSPWALSGTPFLIEAMLTELAQQIKLPQQDAGSLEDAAEVGEGLLEFAQVLSVAKYAVPFADALAPGTSLVLGGVVAGAEAVVDEKRRLSAALTWLKSRFSRKTPTPSKPYEAKSLQEAKSRVCDVLRKLERPVIVVIDDVDRMAPQEVAEIMQAVKAVANFPNVVYILAYDPKIVHHALKVALKVEDGARYLEKVVQFAIAVPEAPSHLLARQLNTVVDEVLMQAGHKASEDELADLGEPLQALHQVLGLIRTPRDLVRIRLAAIHAVKVLEGEICAGDLILLAALEVTAPQVLQWLDKHRPYVLRAEELASNVLMTARHDVPSIWSAPLEERERIQVEWRKNLYGIVERTDRPQAVHAALLFLLDSVNEPAKKQRMRVNHLRVQYLSNWIRWRALMRHEEVFSRSRITQLLKQPAAMEASGFMSSASSFLELLGLATPVLADCEGDELLSAIEVLSVGATRFDFAGVDGLILARHPTFLIQQLVSRTEASHVERAAKIMLKHDVIGPCGSLLSRVKASAIQDAKFDDVAHLVGFWLAQAHGALTTPGAIVRRADHPLRIICYMQNLGEAPSRINETVSLALALSDGVPMGWWLDNLDDFAALKRLASVKAVPGPEIWLERAKSDPGKLDPRMFNSLVEWQRDPA